ncbi:receptor-like serine/threonine-protein kinase [Hibiscus syriacus]|uniref:Receptor-like serine/threonine-protein kinase n=1 Tax=Hibiscus syriacus TaxID=106335 RepID=A0A6A2Z9F5_HIBSY|nr:gamma-glutamyl peptidase 5-like [Hibiscus syriacus]KAE8687712.1 receptor-like serine/threonine-protein kinase [Hibiscus syriacus]
MIVAKKFAVLLCAEDSDYVSIRYGGYYGVFVEMLAEEGETWDVFRVANGEFPDDEEIGDFDGFVITGSCNDAHGNDVWICRLISLLKKLDSLKKKVLGICFGHQILSRALGGRTGRANSGWDIRVRTIHISSSSSNLFTSLKIPTTLSVIECHRDEVQELPPMAEVIAWSEKTGIEMFRYGDHIMGIQGHPEYTKDILFHLIDRLTQRCYIEDSYGDELKGKLEKVEPHKDAWKKLCTSFLKDRL